MFSDQYNLLSGWRFHVMPSLLLPGAVVRHTYREMHALVPPTAAYSLTTPETITLSVPGTATASGRTYYAGASFTVQAVNENFALTFSS